MTNPPDPGHPPRPPAPEQPGGPYGPPPPREQPSGPYPVPPQQQPGGVPGPRPPGPGYGQAQQGGWAPPPRDPAAKSTLGALFDLNFDHMITTRVVKAVYLASVVPASLVALLLAGYGLDWIARDATFFGALMVVTAPFLWLLQMLTVRVFLEFVVNQFKISEYLRAIKDKN